jgi:hypothetical protein
MASDGNLYLSPINRPATETSPTMQDKEQDSQVASPNLRPRAETFPSMQHKEQYTQVSLPIATIPKKPHLVSPAVSIRSLKTKYLSGNDRKSAHTSTRIFISTPEVTMMNISNRLRIRKALHNRL